MTRPLTRRGKRTSLVVGALAIASLGVLSFEIDDDGLVDVAKGSGDSATGTDYVQPSVVAVTMGDTATAASTPSSVPATTKAVPPLPAS